MSSTFVLFTFHILASALKGVPQKLQAPEYLEIDGDRVSICWLPADSALPVTVSMSEDSSLFVQGYDVEFRDFQQDAGWYKVNDTPVRACKMTGLILLFFFM